MHIFSKHQEEQIKIIDEIEELSASISFEPYTVDSVTLLTCNAVLKQRQDLGKWNLAG